MDIQDDTTAEKAARVSMARKAFLDRVVERSGHKRKSEARAIAEATLATLAEVLAGGSDVNVAPLGKVRVVREKATDRGRVLTLRLSLPRPGTSGASLAEPDEAE